MLYIEDLLHKGFYCFVMVTDRNLDDVICGVCGVCPEICLGDGMMGTKKTVARMARYYNITEFEGII